MTPLSYDAFDSPIGILTVAADAHGLRHILFPQNRYQPQGREHWRHDPAALADARAQLLEYFAGRRRRFELPLAPAGTAFQLQVWQALAQIPFGATWSYAELARHVGRPSASRAVGAANGRNPLPIVLPCHRVIGASGALTGFGGGLPTKAALLRLEGVDMPQLRQDEDLFA
ncbi:methylated-DNA--[protein]-cysteine S-methyltransferase [Stenotrophomonas sp. MMGLT7]|uniref:methylated-DNA--[protein]-cysteine S-methyltransferase n=1 Tax=Stenotrophomonas sp. MMGLT7 TaxID=2901227 RepID=UPI001E4684F3|nr:methylated-DNA--[protein]-cysteine S-methyltransferase [Stenotrophomonas sp. MMGLT7]MCD7099697.1 methylated-DNA--[protein]-cysteine S-methyltransferase [Stenotrophomonas sp. MMGLT7]